MNSLLRIRQLYASLAPNDRKLADFLLNDPEQARHLSSQQLSQLTGVSQSSVVKFAQKIGYKGFTALRLALSDALVGASPEALVIHNQILSTDSLKVIGEKLLLEKKLAHRATLDLNDEARLQRALDMLHQARRIVLVGLGASGLVAQDLAYKLLKIGFAAIAQADPHVQLATVQAMTAQDLVLAISFSGERQEINLAAEEAHTNGVPVLAITGFFPNTLQRFAHHILFTVSEEESMRSSAVSSRFAQLALTDLLFMALIKQDFDQAWEHIKHSENLVKKLT